MSSASSVNPLHDTKEPEHTNGSLHPSFSPHEIERICKAFIRLVNAPLVKEQETRSNGK